MLQRFRPRQVFLHSKKIMHRDLKEENVLVATLPTSETRGKFRVTGFGFASDLASRTPGLKEQCLPRSFMHMVGENAQDERTNRHCGLDRLGRSGGVEAQGRSQNRGLLDLHGAEAHRGMPESGPVSDSEHPSGLVAMSSQTS